MARIWDRHEHGRRWLEGRLKVRQGCARGLHKSNTCRGKTFRVEDTPTETESESGASHRQASPKPRISATERGGPQNGRSDANWTRAIKTQRSERRWSYFDDRGSKEGKSHERYINYKVTARWECEDRARNWGKYRRRRDKLPLRARFLLIDRRHAMLAYQQT